MNKKRLLIYLAFNFLMLIATYVIAGLYPVPWKSIEERMLLNVIVGFATGLSTLAVTLETVSPGKQLLMSVAAGIWLASLTFVSMSNHFMFVTPIYVIVNVGITIYLLIRQRRLDQEIEEEYILRQIH